MRSLLEIAVYALKEIEDLEKSVNFGWNGLNIAVSIAKRALDDIEREEKRRNQNVPI